MALLSLMAEDASITTTRNINPGTMPTMTTAIGVSPITATDNLIIINVIITVITTIVNTTMTTVITTVTTTIINPIITTTTATIAQDPTPLTAAQNRCTPLPAATSEYPIATVSTIDDTPQTTHT
ncbi:hypothetical protein LTR70_004260 [Exophiala xenobiotica]|uniref:Uncharacterized protein n=1 Tax=Lithohypha guttulata TaxID=1690604 RepID=A0ABR0KDY6_9EURO|nr:hypothetical protein LTR24_003773 [Lithohypha guttulata]KAK5321015.1 hypothetical protein LTR70_004260 [Exophiala xenobiotica]